MTPDYSLIICICASFSVTTRDELGKSVPSKQQDEARSLGRYRTKKKSRTEVEQQWRIAETDRDGLNRLESLVEVLEHFSYVYDEAIKLAREQEYSWDDIGDVFGISKQSAWERFRDRLDP